jgi:hypothetical protein
VKIPVPKPEKNYQSWIYLEATVWKLSKEIKEKNGSYYITVFLYLFLDYVRVEVAIILIESVIT